MYDFFKSFFRENIPRYKTDSLITQMNVVEIKLTYSYTLFEYVNFQRRFNVNTIYRIMSKKIDTELNERKLVLN